MQTIGIFSYIYLLSSSYPPSISCPPSTSCTSSSFCLSSRPPSTSCPSSCPPSTSCRPSYPSSNSCMLSSSCPLPTYACHSAHHPAPVHHRCAWASPSFPLDCACGSGAHGGGRLVGGRLVGKVSFSEKVVLVLPAIEAGAIKVGFRSRHHGVCHQAVCHQAVYHQAMYHQAMCHQAMCHQGVCHQGVCCQGGCSQGGCCRGGLWILLSTKVGVIEVDSGLDHQGGCRFPAGRQGLEVARRPGDGGKVWRRRQGLVEAMARSGGACGHGSILLANEGPHSADQSGGGGSCDICCVAGSIACEIFFVMPAYGLYTSFLMVKCLRALWFSAPELLASDG